MLDFAQHAHAYQKNGAAHLWNSSAFNGVATLWLDPGYGKTMIVLHAFKALYDAGIVKNMLVVAPLRVAQTVWAQEIDEWASLNGLVAARLHGRKKESALKRRNVNVWIINYEGIPWAIKKAKDGTLPQMDVVCFDEVRRMKNSQGKRFKAARPITKMAKFKWGLTGTPASNGLMDLFGQFLILDDGLALGKYITKYRMSYFEQGYDGFSWLPRPGAQALIEDRIQQYIYRADGYLDLPEFVNDPRKIILPPDGMKTYRAMRKDMITEMTESGDKITAANAAVLMGKLKQIANGRVYDEDRKIIHIHEAKKEALVDLMDELGDEQLLIAYEYNHDLTQLREILGDDVPYLGSGVNERTAQDYVDRWNSGDIRVMCAHPASAGHGLNLQKGAAHHILWWGPTVDLDHYIQFNRRLLRQGNTASHVVVHTFVAEGTVDESVIVSRIEKDGLQSGLLSALTVEFGDHMLVDEETATQLEDFNMSDLTFKSDANQGGGQAPAANPFAPQAQQQPAQQANVQPQQQPVQNNPFAAQPQQQPVQQQPVQQQPVQNEQPAPANPFAQQQPAPNQQPPAQTQQMAITQDVASPPVPQPDPTNAPPNPFAGNAAPVEQPSAPPQEPAAPAPAPVQDGAQTGQTGSTDTGWTPPTEGEAYAPSGPASVADTAVVPVNLVVPLDKLDKVLAAIGRALK